MQVLTFKNITQSMKSFSILMVKICGPYKYTYYIHVSVDISCFLEWCANKNGDQIVSLKRKVTLVLSSNCPIYRIARICLPNGLYDLLSTHVSKGRDKMKRRFHCPICAHSGLSLRCLTVLSWLYLLEDLQEILILISCAHSDGSDEHPFIAQSRQSLRHSHKLGINVNDGLVQIQKV